MKRSIYYRLAVTALLLGATSIVPACAPKSPTGTMSAAPGQTLLISGNAAISSVPASPAGQVVAGVASASPSIVDIAAAVAPKTVAALNKYCPAVQQGLSIAQSCLSGGAAGSAGALADARNIVNPSCTEAGKKALGANDVKAAIAGPTASNSGDSAGYVLSFLALAAKVAPLGCPIGKALLGLS